MVFNAIGEISGRFSIIPHGVEERFFQKPRKQIDFIEGDHILTEISRKFTRTELENLLVESGFEVMKHYESDGDKFSLLLGRPV